MGLLAGQRLGPYEILGAIGAGGMGEVWRARDTRLGRDVAIKTLHPEMAADAQWLERFEREARMIAAINHPGICVLHDLGCAGGVNFLVMELLEGESLASRLQRGALPPADALRIAADIASGLWAAHRRGIVHRDLKPANVMLTPGGVKLLDFGLAKPFDAGQKKDLTSEGMVVGTLYYMAPEQLEGKPVDARADVFSFGALVHEMLTGRKPFDGESQASIIASILSGPRPELPDLTPLPTPQLRHLIGGCLERDPEMRRHSARDLELDLRWLANAKGLETAAAAGPARGSRKPLVAAIAALALTGWASALWPRGASEASAPPLTYTVEAPDGVRVVPDQALAGGSAVSPDGKWLAFVGSDAAGLTSLWIRAVDSLEARPLKGTGGAYSPFWSPDSKSVGFFALCQLRRVDLESGAVRTLAAVPAGDGGTWNAQGRILFARASTGGLFSVPAEGGTPEPVTKVDEARGDFAHTWAWFLPDGQHYLYTVLSRNSEDSRVMLGSLDGKQTALASVRSRAVAAGGGVLYAREQGLVWQALDLGGRKLTGDPRPLAGAPATTDFSAARNGLIVAGAAGGGRTAFQWIARDGRVLGAAAASSFDSYPALAPSGGALAFGRANPATNSTDLWQTDLARGAAARLTHEPGIDAFPAWSRDGQSLLFSSSRSGVLNLYVQNALNPDAARRVTTANENQFAWHWSPDGKLILYSQRVPEGHLALRARALDGGETIELTKSAFDATQGQFSPNGKWVAFTSARSGREEIYLQTLTAADDPATERVPVSTGGGTCARFSADGKELYFLSASGDLMAAPVSLWAKPQIGTPQKLFALHAAAGTHLACPYDVAADGRFLVLAPAEGAVHPRFTVLRNLL